MKALQHMMSDQPPLPLFALLGPFGTGKTYAIGVCVKYLLQHDQTAKVLICTHSNRYVLLQLTVRLLFIHVFAVLSESSCTGHDLKVCT